MEAVHVLVRIDRLDHRLRDDVSGQRQLHQDAVHRRIGVEAGDLGDQRFLGRIGRQADRGAAIPTALAARSLART